MRDVLHMIGHNIKGTTSELGEKIQSQIQEAEMAELVLAGTICKIAGTAIGIATQLYGIGSAIGSAGIEVRLVSIEMKSTAQVLSHLSTVLKSQGRRQPDATR